MQFKVETNLEKEALKNWLFCFLAAKDGSDPSDDYLEAEWQDLQRSVNNYIQLNDSGDDMTL